MSAPRSSSHVPVSALTGTFIFRAPPAKAAVASKALSVGTGYFWRRFLGLPFPHGGPT